MQKEDKFNPWMTNDMYTKQIQQNSNPYFVTIKV